MTNCPPRSSPDCAGICNGSSLLDCAGECYNPVYNLPPHVHDCALECHDIDTIPPHFLNSLGQCISNDDVCPPSPSPRPRKRSDEMTICQRPIHLWVLLILLIAMAFLVFINEKNNKKL
uniref:Uncharacterized protein n=1 Tax=viral metagenome TaxID=1070528 RepID=A0A6C0CJ36_9ZZZZ